MTDLLQLLQPLLLVFSVKHQKLLAAEYDFRLSGYKTQSQLFKYRLHKQTGGSTIFWFWNIQKCLAGTYKMQVSGKESSLTKISERRVRCRLETSL